MRRLRTACWLAGALSVVAFGYAVPAEAQVDDATRSAARSLGYEGVNDFNGGRYTAAVEKLDRAYRALRVPSLGIWLARALEKSGKLVAAAERYREVQQLDLGEGDLSVQKNAQAEAQAEVAALLPRIPNVIIKVEGAPLDQVVVTVNGARVPASLLGVKRPVDPGEVTLHAARGSDTATERTSLRESETKTVVLRLSGRVTDGSGAAAPPPASAPAPPAAQPSDTGESGAPSSTVRTLGFVALGVGGAALLGGAVTGGLAMSTRSSIDGCEGTRCPPSTQDEVDSYNGLRTVSSVCFISGAVLAATGAVLILTAPRSPAPSAARIEPALSLSPWWAIGPGTRGTSAGILLAGRP